MQEVGNNTYLIIQSVRNKFINKFLIYFYLSFNNLLF